MCIWLWPELDCPEVTLCGWQDIKIQLPLLLSSMRVRGCNAEGKDLICMQASAGGILKALVFFFYIIIIAVSVWKSRFLWMLNEWGRVRMGHVKNIPCSGYQLAE